EKIFKVPGNVVLDSPVKPITIKVPSPESDSAGEEDKSSSSSGSLLDSKEQQSIFLIKKK
ncbi:MAG: hypothetical protein ACKO96_27825, partial [Flammeovirgaceae bacterium]